MIQFWIIATLGLYPLKLSRVQIWTLSPRTQPRTWPVPRSAQDAARRIGSVAGPQIQCTWVPKQIADWLDEDA